MTRMRLGYEARARDPALWPGFATRIRGSDLRSGFTTRSYASVDDSDLRLGLRLGFTARVYGPDPRPSGAHCGRPASTGLGAEHGAVEAGPRLHQPDSDLRLGFTTRIYVHGRIFCHAWVPNMAPLR